MFTIYIKQVHIPKVHEEFLFDTAKPRFETVGRYGAMPIPPRRNKKLKKWKRKNRD